MTICRRQIPDVRSEYRGSVFVESVTRADGRSDTFTLTAGVWQADPDVTSRLMPLLNAANQQSGWQLLTAADTVETYTLTGQLTSVTTRAAP